MSKTESLLACHNLVDICQGNLGVSPSLSFFFSTIPTDVLWGSSHQLHQCIEWRFAQLLPQPAAQLECLVNGHSHGCTLADGSAEELLGGWCFTKVNSAKHFVSTNIANPVGFLTEG